VSMKDDLAHRSSDIHWPAGFEPEQADLFAHNDLANDASCERVWRHRQPAGAGCRVVMDEAGIGEDAAALRRSDETLMHRGHDLWLATLKRVAEAKELPANGMEGRLFPRTQAQV
jgi:hypothetical protein